MSEDWGDEALPVNNSPSVGAVRSPGYGFGSINNAFGANALRGMGRGQIITSALEKTTTTNDAEQFGVRAIRGGAQQSPNSSSSGFGSGFGSSSKTGVGFDGLSGSSFGNGFGGGFNGSSSNTNAQSNDDWGSGGGFGSDRRGGSSQGGDRRGGSRACYKCGQEGHMSRDCPSASSTSGGGGGSRACYKCGQEGHMSRDCPSSSSTGGGGGSRACYKCGQEGHMSRECPNAASGGVGGGSRACYKCSQEGHMSRDCPNAGSSDGGSRACYNCGESGHMSRDCPNPSTGGSRGGRGRRGGESSFGDRRGGFGGRPRDDNEPRGGGFDGFSKSNGFGSDTQNDFGGDGFGSDKRDGFGSGGFGGEKREGFGGGFGGESRGGFGGSSGERKAPGTCFKCGQTGHFARECTESGDGGQEGSGGDNRGPEKKRVAPYIPPPLPEDDEHLFETLQKGINFDKYDQIKVECSGPNKLSDGEKMNSFDAADLDDIFKENVQKLHYQKPTPIQKWAVPIILKGRDLMACAQTGSGKTAAFLLPVLSQMRRAGVTGSAFSEIQEPQTLIIGPTRELVLQIHGEARKFAHNTMIRSVAVYGGLSARYNTEQVQKGAHVVVGTPGRLKDFVEKAVISLEKVKFLILDEADRMLDMGFLPAIQHLLSFMPSKTDRQTLMFSATFPEEIQKLAREILKDDYLFVVVGIVGGANADIEQTVYQVEANNKRDKLMSVLNIHSPDMGRTLVFVEQKRNADFLASYLSQSEFRTTSIHGDREQREREEALRDFKNGTAKVLVATSVAARGLDISGVDHVINYDMPQSIDDYVHRIGRTGRCGNIGRATSFFDPSTDQMLARPLVQILSGSQQIVPDWLEELADSSVGIGGFTNVGGKFGARDTRRGGFGGRGGSRFGGNDRDNSAGSSQFQMAPSFCVPTSAPAASAAADDDELWD